MSALSAADLLDLWDRGDRLAPGRRALVLLATVLALPESEASDLAAGARERALLAARKRWFSGRVVGRADCPGCGEAVEVGFDLDSLEESPPASSEACLQSAGCAVRWRLPTAGDLARASAFPTTAAARVDLLRRCVLEVRRDDSLLPVEAWPAEIEVAVERALAAADPVADITLELACPACNRTWSVAFDAATFLWFEIDHLARGLFQDVHRLAMTYGWREADVLNMSAARRAMYLEMCGE